MAVSHRALLTAYLAGVSALSTVLGGFVACGAQTYRVPIHGTEAEPESGNNSGANLDGVHSSAGWSKHLPIHFKTSSKIPPHVVEALRQAMKTWETAVGKDLFQYDGIEEKTGDDFNELYAPLNDQVNGHYFDMRWTTTTGKSSSVLATTIWENDPYDVATISRADIRYNTQFYVFGDSITEYGEGERIIVDMQSLALHELGHLLGLKHISESQDRYSVMNPSLFIGSGMITRRLSRGDIQRIRSVYQGGKVELAEQLEKADDFAGE